MKHRLLPPSRPRRSHENLVHSAPSPQHRPSPRHLGLPNRRQRPGHRRPGRSSVSAAWSDRHPLSPGGRTRPRRSLEGRVHPAAPPPCQQTENRSICGQRSPCGKERRSSPASSPSQQHGSWWAADLGWRCPRARPSPPFQECFPGRRAHADPEEQLLMRHPPHPPAAIPAPPGSPPPRCAKLASCPPNKNLEQEAEDSAKPLRAHPEFESNSATKSRGRPGPGAGFRKFWT